MCVFGKYVYKMLLNNRPRIIH